MDSNEVIWTDFLDIRNGTEAFFDYVIGLEPESKQISRVTLFNFGLINRDWDKWTALAAQPTPTVADWTNGRFIIVIARQSKRRVVTLSQERKFVLTHVAAGFQSDLWTKVVFIF